MMRRLFPMTGNDVKDHSDLDTKVVLEGDLKKTENVPHVQEKILIRGISPHILSLPPFILHCYVIWQETISWNPLMLVLWSASLSLCLGMRLTRHLAVNVPWSADCSRKCYFQAHKASICVT